MKVIIVFLLVTLAEWSHQYKGCKVNIDKNSWSDMKGKCYNILTSQLHIELSASLTYLAMGAHFTTDVHYRPGTAAFFLEGANEERQHAKAIMEYVAMRGLSVNSSHIPDLTVTKVAWDSIEQAFEEALKLEKGVRQNFMEIIRLCEGGEEKVSQSGDVDSEASSQPTEPFNDYHAADLMTGVFLEEQHQSIRKIAGHLSTLSKMKKTYGNFAEIMFDKTLTS